MQDVKRMGTLVSTNESYEGVEPTGDEGPLEMRRFRISGSNHEAIIFMRYGMIDQLIEDLLNVKVKMRAKFVKE